MKQLRKIQVLGDSILKGVQFDPERQRYYTKNEIDLAGISARYGLEIRNNSHFGCTVSKGAQLLGRMLDQGLDCDAVVMDFGGNDCDFKWAEIAAAPSAEHLPNTPLPQFESLYRDLIRRLKWRGILPILTNLPPLAPQSFFEWWCRDLDKDHVLRWLGSITRIYSHQEHYSHRVEQLAREENVPLVDLRGAFLDRERLDDLICADGTHPNSRGQQAITEAFLDFAARYRQGTEALRLA